MKKNINQRFKDNIPATIMFITWYSLICLFHWVSSPLYPPLKKVSPKWLVSLIFWVRLHLLLPPIGWLRRRLEKIAQSAL